MDMLTTHDRTGRDLWAERVRRSPERVFAIDTVTDRRRTYAEAETEVAGLAGGLATLGVGVGTRVLLGTDNHPRTLFLQLAVARLGAVCVPLQPGLTFDELLFQITHSGGPVLLADGAAARTLVGRWADLARVQTLRTVVSDVAPPTEDVGVGGVEVHDWSALAAEPVPLRPLDGYDVDSPATILYTSGSTGRPKGVVLPAGAYGAAGHAYADRFGITGHDVYYLPLTLAHAIGAVTAQAATIVAGGAIAVTDRFSPSRFWADVARARATWSILFPAHLNLVLEHDRRSGGGAADPTTLRLVVTHQFLHAFRTRFDVELATVWGMTETGAMSSGADPGEEGGEGYIGRTMVGVEIGVFDDLGTRLAPGAVGEIRLRHRHVMLGYLDDPDATAQTLVDGWVRSGDLGTVDEEGRLFFQGRAKNMIKRSGENISPEEVESVFAADDRVAEVLVFGVPDRIRTEEVAAVVVLGSPASADDLVEAAGARLVRWKLPRYLRLTTEPLPRLGNGKIDRARVRRGFVAAEFEDRATRR